VWVAALAILVLSTGCLVRRRKIERPARTHAGLLTAGLDQLAETIQQRYQAIETLSATVDLEPTLISASKGEIADFKDVRGYILFRKPAWIRVVALYPIVRGTALDMVSDGENFRLHLPAKSLFLIGPNRQERRSPRKLENLRPQHLLEALLIRPPENGEQAMIENWSDDSGSSYLIHVIRTAPGGRPRLARKIWFDRVSIEITRQQVFEDNGEVATDARYAGWERHGAASFPSYILLARPKDGYELAIRFLKTALNDPLGEDKFHLPEPPGVKVQRVEGEDGG